MGTENQDTTQDSDQDTTTGDTQGSGQNGNQQQTGAGGGTTTNPDEVRLSKADLSRRLDRQSKAAQAALLKELGVESVDALKAKLNPPAQGADDPAVKGELDDLRTQVQKLTERAEKSDQEAEALREQRRTEATLTALKTAVKDLRLKDNVATDIIGWALFNKRDLSKLLKTDLTPDQEAITALLNEAREARPEWFKTAGPGSPSSANGKPTDAELKKKEAAAEAQWKAVRQRG